MQLMARIGPGVAFKDRLMTPGFMEKGIPYIEYGENFDLSYLKN